jgi:hypothetical protein
MEVGALEENTQFAWMVVTSNDKTLPSALTPDTETTTLRNLTSIQIWQWHQRPRTCSEEFVANSTLAVMFQVAVKLSRVYIKLNHLKVP